MTEVRETVWKYTREYIRLRKETNQLLREGKIDKHDAEHRNGNAQQFLLFAQYQLEAAKKTSNQKLTATAHRMSGSATQKTTGTPKSGKLDDTPPNALDHSSGLLSTYRGILDQSV